MFPSPSPIHATFLQNGSRNGAGIEITTFSHDRRDTAVVGIIVPPDALVSSQAVFSVVKAPPALSTNAVAIELPTLWAHACVITIGVRERAMSEVLSALVVPVSDNSKYHQRDSTKRRYDTDDRVLANFRTAAARTATPAWSGTRHGRQSKSGINAFGKRRGYTAILSSVEQGLFIGDKRSKCSDLVRGDITLPDGAKLGDILRAGVRRGLVDLKLVVVYLGSWTQFRYVCANTMWMHIPSMPRAVAITSGKNSKIWPGVSGFVTTHSQLRDWLNSTLITVSLVGTSWMFSWGCGTMTSGRYVGRGAALGWLVGAADASDSVVAGTSGSELVGSAEGVDVAVFISRDETVDKYW
jgi:hypothetical protein